LGDSSRTESAYIPFKQANGLDRISNPLIASFWLIVVGGSMPRERKHGTGRSIGRKSLIVRHARMAKLADARDLKFYSAVPATSAESTSAFEISRMTCV
jgi:hypothetical protein